MAEVLKSTDRGLYCEAGDFYIDPWRPVERAVITHAHSDHARWGMGSYLTADRGVNVLRRRVGEEAKIHGIPYGTTESINGVRVTLYPAGHILGSAQVLVEQNGERWVVSGDYKTESDPTCDSFEPVPCHVFITECTFGLPIYHWRPDGEVFSEINAWWTANQSAGRASLLMGYALGKCQRALAGINSEIGPICVHGSIQPFNDNYREAGIALPATYRVGDLDRNFDYSRALILAPPSAEGSTWTRRFGAYSTAFMSGWMSIRGARRRRSVDRGFVLSDHVDWPSLMASIAAAGAERVLATHGYTATLVRHLREQGMDADVLGTPWEERDAVEIEEIAEP
jgi:putative mRNA 3-end processing factor